MIRHSLTSRTRFVFAVIVAAVLLPGLGLAQAPKEEHKATLRAIMNDLRGEFLALTNALLTDDFAGMEKSAKAIEGHPLPDEIVTAIKNKLGKKFHAFEAVDERSHRAAADLAKRAAAKDLSGSAKAFGRLADGCVSCHKQFRSTLRALSDQ
jgi:cytochrome c556